MPELLGSLASLCFAFSNVLNRRGLVNSNAMTASMFSFCMSAVALWALVPVFVSLSSFRSPAVFYYLAAGVFAPGLGRYFNFMGMERVGMARAIPITNTYPMVASVLAVLVLGEVWTLQNFIGTSFVILGIVILSMQGTGPGTWRKIDLIFPILAALSFGVASNLRKFGLLITDLPIMGAALTSTTGLLSGIVMLQMAGGRKAISLTRESSGWFFAAGVANTAAMLAVFYGLSFGKVVIVEPLVGANPVLALFLSIIFLKDIEKITVRVITGAGCTVFGSILVVTA
ncbi:MAG: EamA family transporter [Deltaproteobacteria bacterium]|nr:EamA family transporter [Deltaproteobacteria bacterium]